MVEVDILKRLTNYGTFEIKLKSFNDRHLPSEDVITSYTITGAKIKIVNQSKLIIEKNIVGVRQFELLVDGVVKDVISYDDSEDWEYDLSVYSDIPEGRHAIHLRAIDEGLNENLSNALFYYVGDASIFGVRGLVSSPSILIRTDDAEFLTATVNTSTGEVHSDFDTVFPWSETEIVEDVAGKFIKFPEMYFRVGVDASSRIIDIAVSAIPHETGNWFKVDPFMYACYGASLSDSKLRSISGVTRVNALTKSAYRTYAANNGSDYHQLDLYHLTVLTLLYWIEFATTNSRSIMTGRYNGSGTLAGSTLLQTGRTDYINTPSGYEREYGQMRYHYIEDFVGNLYEFVDGVVCMGFGARDYVTDDPCKFSDSTTELQQLSYANPSSSQSYPTTSAIGWDSNHPFMVLPISIVNNSNYNTYFCQRNAGIGNIDLTAGCGYTTNVNAGGVFTLSRLASGTTQSYVGARLIKRIN